MMRDANYRSRFSLFFSCDALRLVKIEHVHEIRKQTEWQKTRRPNWLYFSTKMDTKLFILPSDNVQPKPRSLISSRKTNTQEELKQGIYLYILGLLNLQGAR